MIVLIYFIRRGTDSKWYKKNDQDKGKLHAETSNFDIIHRRNIPSAQLPALTALIAGSLYSLLNSPLLPGYCSVKIRSFCMQFSFILVIFLVLLNLVLLGQLWFQIWKKNPTNKPKTKQRLFSNVLQFQSSTWASGDPFAISFGGHSKFTAKISGGLSILCPQRSCYMCPSTCVCLCCLVLGVDWGSFTIF